MPRSCRVLNLKIRRPSALRLSLVLWSPARTTATIISSAVWPGEEKCLAKGRSAFFETGLRCPQAYVRFRQRTTECMPDKLWYTRGYLSCMRTSAVWSEIHRGCWSGRLGWYAHLIICMLICAIRNNKYIMGTGLALWMTAGKSSIWFILSVCAGLKVAADQGITQVGVAVVRAEYSQVIKQSLSFRVRF